MTFKLKFDGVVGISQEVNILKTMNSTRLGEEGTIVLAPLSSGVLVQGGESTALCTWSLGESRIWSWHVNYSEMCCLK